MSYEMTRPAQKWLGFGLMTLAFLLLLFTVAVPYVNHFGDPDHRFAYFTRWSGRWRSDLLPANTFKGPKDLLNFPIAAPILIGIGILLILIGAIQLFWLVYANKSCYFTREKPGPIWGSLIIVGCLSNLIGNLLYESWAFGAPRPLVSWPGSKNFLAETVRLASTFWVGFSLVIIIMGLATASVIYHLDTVLIRRAKEGELGE